MAAEGKWNNKKNTEWKKSDNMKKGCWMQE